MRLGMLLSVHDGSDANALTQSAISIESAGYDSIWSAQAMGRGFMMADPLVALTAVAAVTETVEVGTAILQLPLYNPADLALKCYALAQISGGRFILGVGAGSSRSDYDIHQADFAGRFIEFEQSLRQLREIFVSGEANGIKLNPWASVVEGVPLYFGTWGKNVERAAKEFEGWIASGMHRTVDQVIDAIDEYKKAGGGRAIVSTIQISSDTDLGEMRERLNRYREAKFDDAVVMILPLSLIHI